MKPTNRMPHVPTLRHGFAGRITKTPSPQTGHSERSEESLYSVRATINAKNRRNRPTIPPSKPRVIPLPRPHLQLRPIHLNRHPPVLIQPSITRDIKRHLVPENPTILQTPIHRCRSINKPGTLLYSRSAHTNAKRSNRLSPVILKDREVPLLKIPHTLPIYRSHHYINPNIPGSHPTSYSNLPHATHPNPTHQCH